MGYVFDMAPKGVPRVPQELPKDVPGGDFGVRGEYLRWGILEEGPPKASQEVIWRDKAGIPKVVPPYMFPPYPSSAGAGLPEIALWDPIPRLGHM